MKKNIFCSIVRGWYKELNVKEFCVCDHIELLFLNGLLQNNYFKKLISQKTKLKYTCLKCLFCDLVDCAFVVLCASIIYYRKRKENSDSL